MILFVTVPANKANDLNLSSSSKLSRKSKPVKPESSGYASTIYNLHGKKISIRIF